jgi:membrane protein DedA with SNARE-associated domain/DNA-binding NarL/FixJ family response regulator
MKLGPLILGVLTAGAVGARWRRLSARTRALGAAFAIAFAVWGSGLTQAPNLETIARDVGATLGSYTYLVVAVLAFLETGAGIGLLVPGELAVVIGGVTSGQGHTELLVLIAIVWACVVAGDVTSYVFGRRLGREFLLRHGAVLKLTHQRLEQVETLLRRHGGKTIVVGRFIGLVRALAPFAAGSMNMPARRFLPAVFVAAGLWAASFATLGYVFWQSFDEAGTLAKQGTLALVAIVIGAVLMIAGYRNLRTAERRRRLCRRLRALQFVQTLQRRIGKHRRRRTAHPSDSPRRVATPPSWRIGRGVEPAGVSATPTAHPLRRASSRRDDQAWRSDECRHPFLAGLRSSNLVTDSKQGEAMTIVARTRTSQRTESREEARLHTRLLVVDDHAAVRAGLCQLLDDEHDFEVVAAVGDAEAAMSVAEREPVDVAVVEYQLGSRNGLWLSRKLKRLPSPPAVLIYSAYADGVLAAAAVVAEADGVVNKGKLGAELFEAIRAVARGHSRLRPLPQWLAEALRRHLGHEEQAIFGMLLAGIEREQIAETLNVSAAGLESTLWAMLRKLEAPHAKARIDHASPAQAA